MKALGYLSFTQLKNQIKSLRHNPGKLILYLGILAFIIFTFVTSIYSSPPSLDQVVDIGWLKLFYFGYLLLFSYTTIAAVFSGSNSIFDMADANFLFVSPLRPKVILIHQLVQSGLKSILSAFFILFMAGTLKSMWNLNAFSLLLLFAGFALALVLLQLFSMVVYLYAVRFPALRKAVPITIGILLLIVALPIATAYLTGQPVGQATLGAMNGQSLAIFPLIGWITQLLFALLAGNGLQVAIYALLLAGFTALLLLALAFSKSDYYEDVLVSTEKVFARKQAVTDGNLNAIDTGRAYKMKQNEKNTLWGKGASVFLSRHLLEMRRKNRLFLLDATSFSLIAMGGIMAFVNRDDGVIWGAFAFIMFMRIFFVGTGLGLKELYNPYIFIVPARSFDKLLWSNLEIIVKSLVENVLIFGLAGVIGGFPLGDVIACIVTCTLFVAVLVACNLFSMRIFKDIISQGITMFLYILFVLIILSPGLVAGILLAIWLQPSTNLLFFSVLALWQVAVGLLLFYLSRGVLDTCDMEVMPQKKG